MQTAQATNRHPPRPAIRDRNWSQVQRLLREARISQRDIADSADLPVSTVNRALSFANCGQTQHHIVLRVRRAAEDLLTKTGANINPAEFWKEYDFLLT